MSVRIGDRVSYQGSLTQHHGQYVVELDCRCAECDRQLNQPIGRPQDEPRFELRSTTTGIRLEHVRTSSIETRRETAA